MQPNGNSSDDRPSTPRRKGKSSSARRAGSPVKPTADGSPYIGDSVLDACAAISRLNAFSKAVDEAGLTELLRADGPITVFAPTDRAFEKLASEERTALFQNKTRLGEMLRHHVVLGKVKAPARRKPRTVAPQYGDTLELTSGEGRYHVDDARIVKTNIRASNGVIHAIDTVLVPR
jgi:uncharacterized surface protein with fasciclin (FAS1) repeats